MNTGWTPRACLQPDLDSAETFPTASSGLYGKVWGFKVVPLFGQQLEKPCFKCLQLPKIIPKQKYLKFTHLLVDITLFVLRSEWGELLALGTS